VLEGEGEVQGRCRGCAPGEGAVEVGIAKL
jgi:hypothetical protein